MPSEQVVSQWEPEASPLASRLATPAESSFLSYGLAVHLRSLSTPSRDDAVTSDYRLRLPEEDSLQPSMVTLVMAATFRRHHANYCKVRMAGQTRRYTFFRSLLSPVSSAPKGGATCRLGPYPHSPNVLVFAVLAI